VKILLFIGTNFPEMPTTPLLADLPQIFNGKSALRFSKHDLIVKLLIFSKSKNISSPVYIFFLSQRRFEN
jgi:hypothetical protein